jgi:hypothetical protein
MGRYKINKNYEKHKSKFNPGDLVKISGISSFNNISDIKDYVFTVYVVTVEENCNKYTIASNGIIDRLDESQLELYQAKQYD